MDKIKGENVMKNIKVIMCDIDGTLLNSKGIVTSKTIDAIKKVREQGILFGISTGRDVPSVKRLFGNGELAGLLIWSLEATEVRFMITKPIIMKKILPFQET